MFKTLQRATLITFAGLYFTAGSLSIAADQANEPEPTERAVTARAPNAAQKQFVKASSKKRSCLPGQDDRNSDLCAQWKAADAASDAATWAKLSFILGIFGTIGLFVSLYYTRTAVKVALASTKDSEKALAISERTAKAAVAAGREATEANEIARLTQLAQLRPYLHMSRVEAAYQHMLSFDLIADAFTFNVSVKNFGQTPAKNVLIEAEWALVNGKGWEDIDGPWTLKPVVLGDMPPQFEAGGRFMAMGLKPMHESIISEDNVIEFRAKLTYQDGFGRDYATYVRRYATGQEYATGVMLISDKGNAAH